MANQEDIRTKVSDWESQFEGLTKNVLVFDRRDASREHWENNWIGLSLTRPDVDYER